MENWKSSELAKVCQFINRGISPAYLEAGGVAVLNQKCVRNHAVNFDLCRRHDAAKKKVTPERFLRAGDVLINSTGTGTLGRVAQLRDDPPEPTTVDSHVTIVRPTPGLFHPEFFGYALVAIEEQIQEGGEGCGGQTELSRTKLAEGYRVSFPADQNEQRRIVAILDEAFEGIATARANAERNLQNAHAMFESALDAAVLNCGSGFVDTTLGAEADLVAGYAFSSSGYTDAVGGVRLLRGDNIMQGHLRWDDAKYWPAADAGSYTRFALQEGDVVLAMDRPWVKAGLKRAQIGPDDLPCLQLQRTARLRPRLRMDVGFLYHLTGSRAFSRHLLSVQTGLGVPHISGKQIENFRLMLPSPNEQQAIAGALGTLQQRSDRLEEIYRQKVSALDELKKTLLHSAFTGTLTAKSVDKQVAEFA